MPFYSTLGYTEKLPGTACPTGSVLLCGAMPMHQLQRRQPKPSKRKKQTAPKYAHMARLLFDPQLYLAGLDVNQAPKACAKLATYPWFGLTSQLTTYHSSQQKQADWMRGALARIGSVWTGKVPSATSDVQLGVRECVDLQLGLGCEAIILPSPLTWDPSTSYVAELEWLDEGLSYARTVTQLPIYATVALADLCLRYSEPDTNQLLELIADAVSARGLHGVYLVVEQGSEAADTRQCANSRVLASILHLTHLFAKDCDMAVVVNFLGVFGAVCQAVGATLWSCGWYKSLHRLRLADQGAPGRAYPTYWTMSGGFDVNMDTDFDALVKGGMLAAISDQTPASAGLLAAAARGVSSKQVGAWAYSQSNIGTCTEHFIYSAIAADTRFTALPAPQRVQAAEQWLTNAATTAGNALALLGSGAKTRATHVQAWLDALRYYRRIHNV